MMALKNWLRKKLRTWLQVEPEVQEKLLATVVPRMLTLDGKPDLSDWNSIRDMSTRAWPFFEWVGRRIQRLDAEAQAFTLDEVGDRRRAEYIARRSELLMLLDLPRIAGEEITKILEREKRMRPTETPVAGFGRN